MSRKKKSTTAKPKLVSIDFDNEDGTVDEWVYDTSKSPRRVVQVTLNIRRRTKKS